VSEPATRHRSRSKNLAPGNVGDVFVADVLVPMFLIVLSSRTTDRPDALTVGSPTLPAMKALRRGLIVAVIAVLVGGFVKLRGKGGVPPTSGGWRELDGPDFR
jgi:hypothetical protein